jgi:hypothetical protein
MIVFRCDRLGLPQSGAQSLTPEIITRSREVEPYTIAECGLRNAERTFAGLDMGDRCWFFARKVDDRKTRRVMSLDRIASADVVARIVSRCAQLDVQTLLIDERPLVNEARTLALILNGLHGVNQWPRVPENKRDSYLAMPGGLAWDGRDERWINLRCAIVRFTKHKLGAGITQSFAEFEEGGQTKFVPMLEVNRYETIDRVVRELLTPKENVIEIVHGEQREDPALLLPVKQPSTPLVDTLDAHLITGSEREKEDDGSLGDYVDKVENHFLLADGYSALAELVGERRLPSGAIRDVSGIRLAQGRNVTRFTPRRLRRSA